MKEIVELSCCPIHLVLKHRTEKHEQQSCLLKKHRCLMCSGDHQVRSCPMKQQQLERPCCYRCFLPKNDDILGFEHEQYENCRFEIVRYLIFAAAQSGLFGAIPTDHKQLFQYLWGEEGLVFRVPKGALLLAKYIKDNKLI